MPLINELSPDAPDSPDAPGQNPSAQGSLPPTSSGILEIVTISGGGETLGRPTYQAQLTMRQGEIEPVFGQVSAQIGDTITLLAAPSSPYSAPTFTLFDSTGNAVAGFSGVAISSGNWQTGALALVMFWYVLDTTALAPGAYVARLSAAFQSTADQILRQKVSEVQISVLGSVEIVATYDLTTALGQARSYCLDTDTANAVFTDAEMQHFLNDSAGVPMLAASLALEMLANDNLRLANAIRIGAYKNTSGSIYEALVERAARLRAIAPITPVVVSTPAIFTNGDDTQGIVGTMDIW